MISLLMFEQIPKKFLQLFPLQNWPYLGASICWGHSVLQTPALVPISDHIMVKFSDR